MQIVIEIPEGTKRAIDMGTINQVLTYKVWDAIKNGTPLPEHHGDLKDVSKLVYDCRYDNGNGCDRICHCNDCNYHVVRESDIKTLPTIIPSNGRSK